MITDDKKITTAGYWDQVYAGSSNGKVDNSNTQRPPNPFDRFGWVAAHAEGPSILGIASGHAHVEKRIVAVHPDWIVVASDQSLEAKKAAQYSPYLNIDAYDIPYRNKHFDMVICTQALEYMDDHERFIEEAKRVSSKLLITVPIGEMAKWSQLRIYTEENVAELLELFGVIEVFERHDDLLLVKLKFND
jgi:SAM-dependent methyltransferase